jgi:RNA polymerase sigma factor (sigma-70 family)
MLRGRLKEVLEQLRQTLPPGADGSLTDGQLLACFVARRDEASFAALVRRHGGMVFAVCRRVLGHVQDAEDAFQATFLVLARKASSLRNGEAVGNWLYGVAYRTALEARKRIVRRRAREIPMEDVPAVEVSPAEPQDWRPLLERELNRLPERYRTPVVLCHLEGRSRQEVARQLGVPEGTLSSRLATARQMLAKRLARHHLAISATMLSAALSEETASACVPASLRISMIQDALRVAAGQTVTTPAAVLMKEVLHMVFLTKVKLATVFLATMGVLGVLTASFFAPMRAADEKQAAEPKTPAEPAVKETLVTKITPLEENRDFEDLQSLLHIGKTVKDVRLRPGVPLDIGVDIELYKDGQKQEPHWGLCNLDFGGSGGEEQLQRARVTFLTADLDHLPLAGARKGHCRVQMSLRIWDKEGGYSEGGLRDDVPKALFDFTHCFAHGFKPEAGSATEAPLLYFTGGGKEYRFASTVSELLKKNPKGDFVIVYLRVRMK